MARLKPIRHDEEMSLVDHLDELRSRIIYSIVALVIAFGLCFWQSSAILDIAAAPLPEVDRQLIVLAPTEAFISQIRSFLCQDMDSRRVFKRSRKASAKTSRTRI